MAKYHLDNAYGTTLPDVERGHSNESVAKESELDTWYKAEKNEIDYENTGFVGRATGDER